MPPVIHPYQQFLPLQQALRTSRNAKAERIPLAAHNTVSLLRFRGHATAQKLPIDIAGLTIKFDHMAQFGVCECPYCIVPSTAVLPRCSILDEPSQAREVALPGWLNIELSITIIPSTLYNLTEIYVCTINGNAIMSFRSRSAVVGPKMSGASSRGCSRLSAELKCLLHSIHS